MARFTYAIMLPDGKEITARGLAFSRLADGRIVKDDASTTPDLRQVFASQMPSTTA